MSRGRLMRWLVTVLAATPAFLALPLATKSAASPAPAATATAGTAPAGTAPAGTSISLASHAGEGPRATRRSAPYRISLGTLAHGRSSVHLEASKFTARLAATPEPLQHAARAQLASSPHPQVAGSGSLFAAPEPVGVGSLTADGGGVVSIATGHFDQSGNLDAAAIVCTQCSGPYDAPYQYSAGSDSQYSVVVLPGNGDGTFGTPTVLTPVGAGVPLSMILATDLGNGETDLVVAEGGNPSGTAQILVYLGTGNGTFETPPIAVDAAAGFGITRIAAANLGDGHVDVVATLSVGAYGDNQVEIFTGDGTGHLTAGTPIPLCTASESGCPANDALTDLAVAPLSQGGEPDILVSQFTGYALNNGYEDSTDTLAVLVNNGSGSFSAPSYPVTDMDDTTGIEVGNFTGPSGPPELLLVGGCLGAIALPNAQSDSCQILLHGNGDGTFETPTTANADTTYLDGDSWRSPSANSPVDLTGSGALDALWLPTYVGSNEPGFAEVMLNNGSGPFSLHDVVDVLPPDVQPTAIVAAQLTASGPPDLIVGGVPINNPASDDSPNPGLWVVPANAGDPGTYKSGTGLMSNAEVAAGALASRADPSLAVGDFGLTGNQDLVSAFCAVECQDVVIDTLPNNGDGTFGALQGDLLTGNATGGQPEIGMVSGDWSGNGKLDLAWPDQDGGLTYLLGNGDGTFQDPVHVGGDNSLANYPICCSVDSATLDGVPDIVEATGNNSQRYLESWLWKNGTFSAPVLSGPLTAIPYGSSVAAFGTILPGDPIDAVTMVEGSSGSPVVEVIPGEADGSFDTAAPVVVATACPDAVGAVATGDLRDNGLDDVLWECDGNLYVALNNGDGTFATPQAYPESLPANNSNLMLADVEGDDHPDAIAWGDNAGSGVEVWHNNGDGSFAAGGAYSVGNPTTSASIVAGALTSSGTQDLIALDLSATNDMVTVLTALGGRPALEATSVSAVSPTSPVPGQTMSGSYSVTDTGAAVNASWQDSIYLAPGASGTAWSGSDTLLARLPETRSLAPQGSYAQSFSLTLPDVAPGSYHLVVVPDSSDVLAGTNETPAASPSFTTLAIPTLDVGGSLQSTPLVAGQTLWYEVPVSAGPDVQISLRGLPAGSGTLLYASEGQVPTPGTASVEGQSGSVVLPASDPGSWYLTVVVGSGSGVNGATLTISASTLGLTLRSVSPSRDGVPTVFVATSVSSTGGATGVHTQLPPIPPAGDGELTLTLQGSGFGPGTSVSLVNSTGTYPAKSVTVASSTVLFASFAVPPSCWEGVATPPVCGFGTLMLLPLGSYDVVVTSGGSSVTLPGAFLLDSVGVSSDSSSTSTVAPALSVSFSAPALLRYGWSTYLDLTITNNSSQDLAVPVIDVSSPNALFQAPGASPQTSFSSSVEVDDPVLSDNPALDPSPPGILPGGSTVTIPFTIAAAADIAHELLDTEATILNSSDTTPISWGSLLAGYEPDGMSSADWTQVVSQFGSDFGTTNGAFAFSLVTAFAEAKADGVGLSSETDAIGFLLDEELATDPGAPVTGTLYLGNTSHPLGNVPLVLSDAAGDEYTATSWYDGRFAFFDVPAGSYELSAEGYLPASLQAVDVSPTAQGLSVVAQSAASLSGVVSDQSSSSPIAGAIVTATDSSGTTQDATTAADGSYMISGLAAGAVTVSASAPGYEPANALGASVSSSSPANLDISLAADGSIAGTVDAPGGGAVAGATVDAELTAGGPSAQVTTASDGSFTIPDLAPGQYQVVAEDPGYGPAIAGSVSVSAGATTPGIGLTLAPSDASVSGQVTDADTGQAIAGAVVSTNDANGGDGAVTTGSDGSFTLSGLPPGPLTITVVPPDDTHLTNTAAVTTVAGQTASADVTLDPSGTLDATILAGDGTTPLAGISAVVVGPSPGSASSPEQSQQVVTDSNGELSLVGLDPGSYDLQVEGSDAHASFTIASGSRTATVSLIVPTGTLTGQVVDASGNAVAGVEVTLCDSTGPVASTTTDAGGDYRFTVTGAGSYDVVASGNQVGLLVDPAVSVATGSTTTAPVLQAGTASLSVSVSAGGQPDNGATVTILTQSGSDGPAGVSATADATGTALLDNLTPGSYELQVSDASDALASQPVTVAAGAGTAAVTMSPGGSIAGTVTDSASADVAGASVTAEGPGGVSETMTTGSDGSYTLAQLPAGTYTLSVSASGDAPALVGSVTVGAGSTTTENVTLPTTGASLTVSLDASAGSVLPSLTATLEDASGTAVATQPLGPAVSASDGAAQATFSPLQAGSYTLLVSGLGLATTSEPVTVTASGTSVEVTAPGGEVLPPAPTGTSGAPQAFTAGAPQAEAAGAGQPLVHGLARVALAGVRRAAFTSLATYWQSVQFFMQSWSTLLPNPQNPGGLTNAYTTYQDIYNDYLNVVRKPCYNPYLAKAQAYLAAAAQALNRWQGDYSYLQEQSYVNKLQLAGDAASAVAAVAAVTAAALAALPLTGAAAALVGTAEGAAQLTAALNVLSGVQIASNLTTGLSQLDANGGVNNTTSALSLAKNKIDNALKEVPFYQRNGALFAKLNTLLNLLTSAISVLNDLVSSMQSMSKTVADGKASYNNFNYFLGVARSAIAAANSYECPRKKPYPPPQPPKVIAPFGHFNPQVVNPHDPNELIGPPGDGSAAEYIQPGAALPYTVLFANDGSAPATIVDVSVPLPAGTEPSSLQLTGFGFGSTSIPLSGAGGSFSDFLTGLGLANGDDVSASGSYDAATNTVEWTIEAINPATGDVDGTPSGGFLPPDDASGDGEGYVSFSLQADPGLATGTTLSTTASVVFDDNAAITTNTWTNTIDATPPEASVAALPATVTSPFTVSWSGRDEGSGIASYNVYVSEDDGAYELWQSQTTATSAAYSGSVEHSYAFVALATDEVGNTEPFPNSAQSTTTVVTASSGGGSSGTSSTPRASAPPPASPAPRVPAPPLPRSAVLWLVGPSGRVARLGATNGLRAGRVARTAMPVAAIASTPDGRGYWVSSSNGQVRAAGDAHLYPPGSHGKISGPVVAMAATPDGTGYWLATAAGRVYPYGDASSEARDGSTTGAGTVMAIVATPDGKGYWLASTSGKVVAYGDARLAHRSGPAVTGPFVAMAATPDGKGYWLATADGHVEAFGDATVERGARRVSLHAPVVAMAATPDGKGYWLATADGHVEAFGDAPRYAAAPRARVLGQVVAIAAN